MKSNRIKYVPLLTALLAACLLLAGCSAPAAPSSPGGSATVEDAAAADSGAAGEADTGGETGEAEEPGLRSFTAATLDGGSFTAEDIGAKDVTVLNFWALSCGPCIAEMPDLAAFAAALPDNVGVATVCLDGYGNQELAMDVLEDTGLAETTMISGDGDLAELCSALVYTPTTVFLDGEGTLADVIVGGQEDLSGTFLAAVNKVLAASGKAEISLAE